MNIDCRCALRRFMGTDTLKRTSTRFCIIYRLRCDGGVVLFALTDFFNEGLILKNVVKNWNRYVFLTVVGYCPSVRPACNRTFFVVFANCLVCTIRQVMNKRIYEL